MQALRGNQLIYGLLTSVLHTKQLLFSSPSGWHYMAWLDMTRYKVPPRARVRAAGTIFLTVVRSSRCRRTIILQRYGYAVWKVRVLPSRILPLHFPTGNTIDPGVTEWDFLPRPLLCLHYEIDFFSWCNFAKCFLGGYKACTSKFSCWFRPWVVPWYVLSSFHVWSGAMENAHNRTACRQRRF